ncbi:hypothetical protein PVAND_016387 [Polypedilum vanderplanki]|uniref:Metalloendopeptidase n=1 Tax=Polypedilum vanderplanki TaxID=319348 RepID=A0A9J6BFS3_POLVA|nr:hypothetical protein PVAND_016387 [Polypedilum vanderplanki]
MKPQLFFIIIFLFPNFSNSSFNQFLNNNQEKSFKNSSVIVTAIKDFIKVNFINENIDFDIITIGNISNVIDGGANDVIDLILEESEENFAFSHGIIRNLPWTNSKIVFNKSAMIFIDLKTHNNFLNFSKIKELQKEYTFLIISDEIELEIFEDLIYLYDIHQFSYFLFNSKFNNEISLKTIVLFDENSCKNYTIKNINFFNKLTKKWKNPLRKFQRFQNFHNCTLKVCILFYFYRNKFTDEIYNEEIAIMNEVGKKLNFRPNFSEYYHITEELKEKCYTTIGPTVYLKFWIFKISAIFFMEHYGTLITPGEFYDSYEKLLLPFDEMTWLMLILTFAIAFIVILIVNQMPQKVKNLIYGKKIATPAFRVVATFYGISQQKLPDSNFARLLLLIFIWFCLIIRTAYQGVFFEMMTTDMRKPPLKTLEEVFAKNYTVLMPLYWNNVEPYYYWQNIYKSSKRIKIINYYNYFDDVCNFMFDPSAKTAMAINTVSLNTIRAKCHEKPLVLEEKLRSIWGGIGFISYHNFFDKFNNISIYLNSGGILNYHKNMIAFIRFKNWVYFHENSPQILTLEGLSFGFFIWLISCFVAFLAFIYELICWKLLNIYGSDIERWKWFLRFVLGLENKEKCRDIFIIKPYFHKIIEKQMKRKIRIVKEWKKNDEIIKINLNSIPDFIQLTSKRFAMKIQNFLIIFNLIFFTSVFCRPQNDRIVFRDENDGASTDSLLPGPNNTIAFIIHPQAQRSLENGNYFQGDMNLLPQQEKYFTTNDTDDDAENENEEDGLFTRTGIINTKYRWPKDKEGHVILPYVIDELAKFSTLEKTMIKLAMEYIEYYTCVRFVERTDQVDYIFIKSGAGCYSNVGKTGGKQIISFQKGGCFTRGTLMHEIIHSLGYDHMQNHADRDQFVTIKWENINTAERHNFERVDARKYSNFGTPYDYNSVMHYNPKAFSKNGKETIVPKDPQYRDKIGQRRGLSTGDVQRINNMYSCNN